MKTSNQIKIGLATAVFIIFTAFAGKAQEAKKVDEIKIQTSAICNMCKEKIETNMAYEKGVKDVVLDTKTKICTIKYTTAKTNPADLRKAISKLGYDADDVKADSKAYEKLPACCKKDAAPHE